MRWKWHPGTRLTHCVLLCAIYVALPGAMLLWTPSARGAAPAQENSCPEPANVPRPSDQGIHGYELRHIILSQTMPVEHGKVVKDDVDLRGQTIRGPVSLSRFRFQGQVLAAGATFERGFTVTDSVFEKPVDLSAVLSRGWVSFDYNVFKFAPVGLDANVSLSLWHARIEGGLALRGNCFLGPVDASLASITSGLSVRDGWFLYEYASEDFPSIDLSSTVVGGNAVLKNNKIQPPIDFSNLIIGGSMDLHGTVIANRPTVDTPTPIRWNCPAGHYRCRGSSLDGLRVGGPANLQGAVLQGCLGLPGASFGVLDPRIELDAISKSPCTEQRRKITIPGPRDPQIAKRLVDDIFDPLNIDGLRYTQIAGGHEAIAFMTKMISEHVCVSSLPQEPPCDPSRARAAFALLESVAAVQGDREGADGVFIRAQWWDVVYTQTNTPWGWGLTIPQKISGYYVGFGRRPLQAILTWLVFFLVGVAAFFGLRYFKKVQGCVNPVFYCVQSFLPPEWTKIYPVSFKRPAKVFLVLYLGVAFALLAMFVFSVSGASWPAVLPICVAGAAVVHRLFTAKPQSVLPGGG